ncbi:MAG: DNA primase small subunit domain-containing protein [Candidatus Odinarchaeia archaeon]
MGPSDCYHSAAYYNNPVIPEMNKKGWYGCDLIFDIDADHLDTDCKKEHDIWKCKKCGKEGKGEAPNKCPNCDGESFQEQTWICENCLSKAKEEIIKVSEEFLIKDFGIDPDEIEFVFSGHRGYHIHVKSDTIKKLDSNARREIIDYIEGNGVAPEYLGFYEMPGKIIIGPKKDDYGWRGRLTRFIIKFFQSVDESILKKINFEKRKREFILNNTEQIINNLSSVENNIPGIQGISWDFGKLKKKDWEKIIEFSIKEFSGKIDEPVTADIHRLIRLPDSLNGKTGFKVQRLTREELDSFDPFSDPLVFKGTLKIKVKRAPRTVINGKSYGPYFNEEVEVPSSVGIFLMCKNVAELTDSF